MLGVFSIQVETIVEETMSGESFSDSFTESFLTYKEKPAITFLRDGKVETEISYLELHQDTNRMANIFLARGVKKVTESSFLSKSP